MAGRLLLWFNEASEIELREAHGRRHGGAQNEARFLPMWSRRKGDSILLTFGGGNDWEKTGDEKAAQAVFNGGGDGIRWCNGGKDFSDGGGVCWGSSSMRRHGLAMVARVWVKFARDRVLFIGVLVPNRTQKNPNNFLIQTRLEDLEEIEKGAKSDLIRIWPRVELAGLRMG
jgi:hypothetical protein